MELNIKKQQFQYNVYVMLGKSETFNVEYCLIKAYFPTFTPVYWNLQYVCILMILAFLTFDTSWCIRLVVNWVLSSALFDKIIIFRILSHNSFLTTWQTSWSRGTSVRRLRKPPTALNKSPISTTQVSLSPGLSLAISATKYFVFYKFCHLLIDF